MKRGERSGAVPMSGSCGFQFPALLNQQCLPLTGTREQFAQRTNSPIRKETEGTSEEEGGGRDHRCGRGCLSPRNSSNSCLHAGTGSHSHFCFSDMALAHHPHDDTEITLGIRDCLSLGSTILRPDPSHFSLGITAS